MKDSLIEMFTSKKFLAAIAAAAIYGIGHLGLGIDPDLLTRVYVALLVYVGGQGLADMGKSAALIHAGAAKDAPAAPAASSSSGAATMLAVLLLGAVALQPACSSAGQRAAAGVGAFIDCEAPEVAKLLPDLIPLAKSAVLALISGDGHLDTTGLKADAKPIRSDLGKCALATAIAILATPEPAKPDAPAAAPLEVDSAQLRAAFASVRGELGWAPVRTSAGVL